MSGAVAILLAVIGLVLVVTGFRGTYPDVGRVFLATPPEHKASSHE